MIPCALNLALRGVCPLARSLARSFSLVRSLSLSLSLSLPLSLSHSLSLSLSIYLSIYLCLSLERPRVQIGFSSTRGSRSTSLFVLSARYANGASNVFDNSSIRVRLFGERSATGTLLALIALDDRSSARSLARTRSRARDEIRDTAAARRLARQAAPKLYVPRANSRCNTKRA